MLDLRYDILPNAINVNGVDYLVHTDYRVWIEFERVYREEGIGSYCIFAEEPPSGVDWLASALEFLASRNSTPNAVGSENGERVIDYVQDGAYIYAAFMQAYGIDLLQANMHWHVFKALIDGLPSNTRMHEIMGYRSYEKSSKKAETMYQELKRRWTLPSDDKSMEEAKDAAGRLYDMLGGE